jgi:hypothetical protein
MFKQKSKKLISIKRALLLTIPVIVVATSFVAYFGRHNTAEAATNGTINFQARLLNTAGSIVPDGNYNVEFKLYNASSSSGSSQGSCSGDSACLWTETRTSSDRVRVANGYMTVNLGSVTAFGAIDWDQELWLTMNVGGTLVSPSFDGEMSPRLKLTAVPYAFRAGSLVGGSGANTTKLTTGTPSGNNTIALPAETGTVCLQSSTACGFAASTGSTSYINNSTTLQTANFHIQSASATSVGAIIRGAASQTSSLLQMVDGTTGYSVAQFTNNGYLYLGSDNISRTGQIVFHDGTLSNAYTATFTAPAALTASRTITIPDETGTVCLQSSTGCGFAASTGSANYIQNQFTSAQSTASYWISGTGRAATALQAPLVDAATSGVLAIGTTLATEIDLNQNVVVANNKTLTANGTVLFKAAANAISAFAIQNADASQTLLNADTTNGRIGIGGVATYSKFEVIGGDAAVYNSGGNPRLILGDSTSAGENGYLQWDSANNYFRIESVGTNGLKINDNYVTIGNIYPSQPLIVANGTTKLFEVNTTGSVLSQTSTNSATAFQIQNSSNAAVLDVDTSNNRVGVNRANPAVELDVLGVIQQTGMSTPNTDATDNGKWTELGSCTMDARYQYCNTVINIMGGGSGEDDENTQATVSARVKQQAALGAAPIVNITLNNTARIIAKDDIKAVTTQNDGSATVVQLWGRITNMYEEWNYTPVVNQGWVGSSDAPWRWTPGTAFQASLPTGTQTSTIYGDSYANTLTVQNAVNSVTAFQVQNATSSNVLTVDTSNSRVGIGNAAPTVDLDVGPLSLGTSQIVQVRIGDLLLQSQQGAASGITVSNSRGSNGNLTLDGISGGGVYLSPFTTNNNYLASGGGNVRVGSQVAPSHKLDVTGNVNVSSGSSYKINGTDICTASGCTASSASAILNQSGSAQSANFWLQSATDINTATIQTNATQTADLLQFKSSTGGLVAGIRPSGAIWSAPITDPVTDVPSTARLFVQPLANASTAIIARAAAGGAPTGDIIKLQDATGANNLLTVGASGVVTFQNTTNSDAAFVVNETGGNAILRVDTTNQRVAVGLSSGAIPSKLYVTTSSTVSLRAKQTGSSDVFQLANGTADLMTVGSTGATLFKNTTNSTTAFSVQNSSSVNLMNVDTTASQVSFGAATLPVQLNVNGDLNMGTSLETPQGFEGATFVPTSPGTWSTGGNGNWARTTSASQEGSASAVGADVADLQTSWLDLNYTFTAAGTLSFYWSVSSEEGWDYLVVCVDSDATCTRSTGYSYRISGEVPWTQVRLPVASGAHSFRWLYGKDDSSTDGSDLGWIDNVRFESGTGNINGNSLQFSGASGINLASTTGNIVIGASDTTGTLLVLDTKTSSGDPTGMAGAMYYNSSMKSFRCYQDGVWRSCMGGLVYANTTWPTGACNSSNTVANTTSACDFASQYTMPLSTCQVGKVFRVHAAGYLSTSSGTFRIELKKGSTVLNTTGVATINSGMGSTQWDLQGYITCISTTSIDSFATFKYTYFGNDTTNRWIEWSMPESGTYPASYGSTTTISSSSEALKLTATWGTASTSNSITLRQLVVEEMGP